MSHIRGARVLGSFPTEPLSAAVERARDGARSQTMGIYGIMKKTLIASVALASLIAGGASAADLPMRPAPAAAPVYVPAIFSWTSVLVTKGLISGKPKPGPKP